MNILFRADASDKIGTGHVMRCLTLADELTQKGASISFICREEPRNLIKSIKDKGYEVSHLPAGISLETDLELVKKVLRDRPIQSDWLIVDHYDIDSSWEHPLRGFVKRIMVIDDLANRQHDCDLLLDQNFTINVNCYDEIVPAQCVKLVGAEYTLIRPQFRDAREGLRERNGRIKRILVFMGGTDASNETCKVLRGIRRLNRPDIATDVVIGASNIHAGEVEALAAQIPNVICYNRVENMAELMVSSDLSIGASGTTTWERCSVGLPSLVIIAANNQKDIAGNLSKNGIVINLGWFEDVKEKDIASALEDLLDKPDTIRQMSLKSMEVVDALGTGRVARELIC